MSASVIAAAPSRMRPPRAAERGEIADARGREHDHSDDADELIAALEAPGEHAEAEHGPGKRRHVEHRAQDGARAAGLEHSAGIAGIERAEDLALADH